MSPPDWLLSALDAASSRLDLTVGSLSSSDFAAASGLPQWRRGHVLTHVARNADGLRNLLLAARSGEVVRMYACPTARAADVESGALRPAEVIAADVAESSRRFGLEAALMTPEAWRGEVQFTSGQPDPPTIVAEDVPFMRLNEVELHHVDLAAGYSFDDTPDDVARHLLEHYSARRRRQGIAIVAAPDDLAVPPSAALDAVRVEGPTAKVLAWLTGRSAGDGLRCEASLPLLPSLG